MIIRENEHEFILIHQHDHALISEQIMLNLKATLFPADVWKASTLYAIKMHDVGWIQFDDEPFWNDEKQMPYSFIDYPNRIKTVLYKHGIDEVVKEDVYAGLLCSMHYSFFLANDPTEPVRAFVAAEETRQKEILAQLGLEKSDVTFHFELLKFADDLSLFLCIHEPGASEDKTHYFFKKGVRVPEALVEKLRKRLLFEWQDNQTIKCQQSLFENDFSIRIPYKAVSKTARTEQGLRESYHTTVDKSYLITVKS